MKILKIFGIVVGIHLFALILIFANPGCTTSKPAASPADTVAKDEATAPTITVPGSTGAADSSPLIAAPVAFNPDAPAVASSSGSSPTVVRYSPTRPGTPVAAALQSEPVADVTPVTTYTTVSGDSLWLVAKKNHLTVSELAAANNLKAGSTLRQGQKLIIPGKSGASAGAAAAPVAAEPVSKPAKTAEGTTVKPSSESVKHTVKPGESLGMIAKKYGVKQGDIAVANNISDPQKIPAGMELIIPGWQAPSGKSAKAAKPADTASTPKAAKTPAAKPVVESKPLFSAPESTDVGPKPAPVGTTSASDVPVIKVDDDTTPAAGHP